ncbi:MULTISPECIES: integrase arm-type DNA-binding domain-containing protein [unclassified Oleiphilus]|uniref:tyrosine-type recombinase/integrase n=1 Tax=unclassified Oleiphilus TaxID=2631174 RepID=UPI0007C3549F|nr:MULTISPECIES: integrase arm-type DNA-binding domain-containing protein [unclassified Oleiphilus]KZY43606.1 integrase [Oleiphilus sp. HI0050]KZZ35022.1 integrase [Oleiphilus sp. HI0086]KZZ37562.1 integrase [Oleiphilus sp. HI0117]KZZ61480.1 integrase [Oleiphilus sp. HI0123]
MKLTATKVDRIKSGDKDLKLSDGRGLFLLVKTNGRKYWRLSYRFHGKQKTISLGIYPDTSLAKAREQTSEAKNLLAAGEDPSQIKRIRKANQLDDAQNTFRSIALEWFEVKMLNMSDGHKKRVLRALERDMFPHLGCLEVRKVNANDLLVPLKKIEGKGKLETAHRAKQTAGQILRYAVATGRADRDCSIDLKGALKIPKEKNRAAITCPTELGVLLNAIDGYNGGMVVKTALTITPHLFIRPGELRKLEWNEINWENRRIEIPDFKMKMREAFIVPLSNQVYTILEQYKEETGQRGAYVFPSARGASRPLSDNGIRTALRTLGYDNETVSPHGFRATARTLLDEILGYRIDYIEHQLAHAVKDTNGRAYNRTSHLEGRIEMMQSWSNYLDQLKNKHNGGKN